MFSTIDTHVAGEAFRIIIHSPLVLDQQNIEENHKVLHQKYKDECDFLLNEPRGHKGMNGCVVLPSGRADLGILLFSHTQRKLFSYSGLVAIITALLETGNLERTKNDKYSIETIYGIYQVQATVREEQVVSVSLKNKETRVVDSKSDFQVVDIDGERRYVVTALLDEIPGIRLDYLSWIMKQGKDAVGKYTEMYPMLSGVILTEREAKGDNNVRSITFDSEGKIVRSPGIDSTFAILSLYIDTGRKKAELTNKNIYDSELIAHVVDEKTKQFSIQTQGFITGMHQFVYDRDDPLKNGFLLK